MEFKQRTLSQIADMICGNFPPETSHFLYRSSSKITQFFEDAGTNYVHDGSTRSRWVAQTLADILNAPQISPTHPPDAFLIVIQVLMDKSDAINESSARTEALTQLNITLSREGFESFYSEDGKCYLRHISTQTISSISANPHRPFTEIELAKRAALISYLDSASEDELILDVLLPLFRRLGFQRITPSGHKDKAQEYGKDMWMKFILPTLHVIYFGIQTKKGKLDSSGLTKTGNINIAEVYNQVLMMLGHEIFDPEISKKVLVDHAIIISGGEITKAARNWLGGRLDLNKRSQILFMDREDILNLFVVTSLVVPGFTPKPRNSSEPSELPF
jgi:hypothetical protein